MADDKTFIEGRSGERASLLLELAEKNKIDRREVRAVHNGYEVPAKLATAYEEHLNPPKKSTSKSTTTKSTAKAGDKDKE